MQLKKYIEKLKASGNLDEYAYSCGVTASYLDRVLRYAYYRPKQRTYEALYQKSKGNVTKKEVDAHFSVLTARCK